MSEIRLYVDEDASETAVILGCVLAELIYSRPLRRVGWASRIRSNWNSRYKIDVSSTLLMPKISHVYIVSFSRSADPTVELLLFPSSVIQSDKRFGASQLFCTPGLLNP
jgi:hypothetical protein